MKIFKIWSLAVVLLMTMVACGGDKGGDTGKTQGGSTTVTGNLEGI